ncbi:MAG: LemA family protein [Dehalogenimonas sp.]|uniref:LemA family protein n=1 Tax=Candidatus Dehalogenimonas loeffleri TaxID=3127115 RepID=A0ABZ2J2E0_9CHLR|nr:LemA family protein [Dehalogenimonas sp.]
MKKLLIGIGIAVALLLVIALPLINTYNSLVTRSQSVDAQWAQVETQYQRRFDLIPNLVESVKGIMAQEQAVFIAIADARTRYAGADTATDQAAAANDVESALARLLVVMENYPELRSIETVTTLMDELAGTENRIAVERGRYNTEVRDYNTAIKRFPTVLIAGMFGFDPRDYFESFPGTDQPPVVDFS